MRKPAQTSALIALAWTALAAAAPAQSTAPKSIAALAQTTSLKTAGPPAATAGDAVRGKTLAAQRCVMCHSVEAKSKASGPSLLGVFGRKAGAASDFKYSKAMLAYAAKWDGPTLDAYLAAPTKTVPGAIMPIGMPVAADRTDVIAYLKTLK